MHIIHRLCDLNGVRRCYFRTFILAALCLSYACQSSPPVEVPGEDSNEPAPDPCEPVTNEPCQSETPNPVPPSVVVSIRALDIWGQPLVDPRVQCVDSQNVTSQTTQESLCVFQEPGNVVVEVNADHHLGAAIQLEVRQTEQGIDIVAHSDNSADAGWVLVPPLEAGGNYQLTVGLEHLWFSQTGRPARFGNRIELLMDGQEAWQAVEEALVAANHQIHIAAWWWDSEFQCTRPSGPDIMSQLDATPAQKRVLLYDGTLQWALESGMNRDAAINARGEDTEDNFEFMLQPNNVTGTFIWSLPSIDFKERLLRSQLLQNETLVLAAGNPEPSIPDTPVNLETPFDFMEGVELNGYEFHPKVASQHQKFVVIDGVEAFVGGMNLRNKNWDTIEHAVFEPLRGEYGPRKDYQLHLVGPAVEDVAATFKARWDDNLQRDDAWYLDNATQFEIQKDLPEEAGGLQIQITNTLPAPIHEYSIFESHLNAIRQAKYYIFVEDQYWRSPILTRAILERMAEVPTLELIVVTNQFEWTNQGCYWSRVVHDEFVQTVPERFHSFRLESFSTVEVEWGISPFSGVDYECRDENIFIHSKLMMVDDVFLSLGSANKNNRGMLYEGEMNVVVFDPREQENWIVATRQRILENLLGEPPASTTTQWIAQLDSASAYNESVENRWLDEHESSDTLTNGENDCGDFVKEGPLDPAFVPRGFLYPLNPDALGEGPMGCLWDAGNVLESPDLSQFENRSPQAR